jgi:hypothetical protein
MTQVRGKLLAWVAGLVVFGFAATTTSADQLLTGSITSATGQKLEGVQIAASGGAYSGAAARNPCRPARLRAISPPECAGIRPPQSPGIRAPKSSTETLKQEPPAGSLPAGQTVLVDDGSCPSGQIKRITGGSNINISAGQYIAGGAPRQRKCIKRKYL